MLALSGALSLGNEGSWLSDGVKRPQPEERPDAAVGLDLRLAVPRAAGNGGDEAQGAQDAQEQGSLRLLLTLAGCAVFRARADGGGAGRAGCRARLFSMMRRSAAICPFC